MSLSDEIFSQGFVVLRDQNKNQAMLQVNSKREVIFV